MTSASMAQISGSPLPLRSSISGENFGLNPGAEPLRLRSRRSQPPSSIRGWSSSTKTIGPAVFESLLERDAQTLISVDARVERYAVQSHRLIYWTSEGASMRRREYTPDLVLEMQGSRRVVVEVKARALAEMQAWTKVEAHIRQAYREDHDATFVVLTEEDIRQEPRLSNAQIMLAHRGLTPPEIEFALLSALEAEGDPVSIRGLSEILDQLGISYDQTFTAAMQCALVGKAEVDFSRAFSPATQVWLS